MPPHPVEPQPDAVLSLLSEPGVDAEQFWHACDVGRLRLPKCTACHRFSYFPRLHCPHCGCRELVFDDVERYGSVHSFAHVRFSPFGDYWVEEVPYTVVRVDLDDGVRLLSRLVGGDREQVRIGDRVEIQFAPVKRSERKIPVFVRRASQPPEKVS